MRRQQRAGLRGLQSIAAAAALISQWLVLHALAFAHDTGPEWIAVSAGLAIFGAAFCLSWAAEAAQIDIPESLSLAFLALIAVLPEYAVDIYFAWQAGTQPHYIQYATANMTGANRILIGLGWPVVVFAYYLVSHKREIRMSEAQRPELFYLLVATLYSFVIPWKGTLTVFDSLVLLALFVAYVVRLSRTELSEPELAGAARLVASLPTNSRRLATLALFLFAGTAVFTAAKPFAESLLSIGKRLDVDEFLLVQWLAPLASETPEFIVAVLFCHPIEADRGFFGAFIVESEPVDVAHRQPAPRLLRFLGNDGRHASRRAAIPRNPPHVGTVVVRHHHAVRSAFRNLGSRRTDVFVRGPACMAGSRSTDGLRVGVRSGSARNPRGDAA